METRKDKVKDKARKNKGSYKVNLYGDSKDQQSFKNEIVLDVKKTETYCQELYLKCKINKNDFHIFDYVQSVDENKFLAKTDLVICLDADEKMIDHLKNNVNQKESIIIQYDKDFGLSPKELLENFQLFQLFKTEAKAVMNKAFTFFYANTLPLEVVQQVCRTMVESDSCYFKDNVFYKCPPKIKAQIETQAEIEGKEDNKKSKKEKAITFCKKLIG